MENPVSRNAMMCYSMVLPPHQRGMTRHPTEARTHMSSMIPEINLAQQQSVRIEVLNIASREATRHAYPDGHTTVQIAEDLMAFLEGASPDSTPDARLSYAESIDDYANQEIARLGPNHVKASSLLQNYIQGIREGARLLRREIDSPPAEEEVEEAVEAGDLVHALALQGVVCGASFMGITSVSWPTVTCSRCLTYRGENDLVEGR